MNWEAFNVQNVSNNFIKIHYFPYNYSYQYMPYKTRVLNEIQPLLIFQTK